MKQFQRWFWPLVLMVLVLGLASVTYKPGTWLSGWDTLHSEFDFPLALKRAWSGVWQEHQGMGAVASQAHMTDLVRLPWLVLLWMFLPLSALRYGFFFLTWIFGVLGMYVFLKKVVLAGGKLDSLAFLGAVLYLLNPITMQQYVVPLEMFGVFFASFPWLLWLSYDYVTLGDRKRIFWYGLASLVASPMAHTATLFYAYTAALGVYLMGLVGLNRKNFTRALSVMLVTLGVNAYWLLPNVYYVANHAQGMSRSFINATFSDEARLQNQASGSFGDLILMKNFLFNWQVYSFEKSEFVPLLEVWAKHYETLAVKVGMYVMFGVGIMGLLAMVVRKRGMGMAMVTMWGLGAFFLLNSNPPLGFVYDFISERIGLFREGFRLAFTKFSFIYLLALIAGFVYGMGEIVRIYKARALRGGLILVMLVGIVWMQMPALSGHMVSERMKVTIPQDYFDLFGWFSQQDLKGRVLKLPLASPYGWNYYAWGYQGAGFTWFGIPQPTLDREFDRWEMRNEEAYLQFGRALYSDDAQTFEGLAAKYNISYVLVDESVFQPGYKPGDLRYSQTKKMLEAIGSKVVYQKGWLSVYGLEYASDNKYTAVLVDGNFSNNNEVFDKVGNYFVTSRGIGVPFGSFDGRSGQIVELTDSLVTIKSGIDLSGMQLTDLPQLDAYSWPLGVFVGDKGDGKVRVRLRATTPGLRDDQGLLIEPKSYSTEVVMEYGEVLPQYLFINNRNLSLIKSREKETFLGYVPINLNEPFDVELARAIDGVDGKEEVFTELVGKTANLEVSNKDISDSNLARTDIRGKLTAIFPLIDLNNRLEKAGRSQAFNCDERGDVLRERVDDGVLYSATKNGSSCDFFDFRDLNGFDGYLLWQSSKNESGRGIKAYVYGKNLPIYRNEFVFSDGLETRVLEPLNKWGFVVNIESRSFGAVQSRNLMQGIGMVPFNTKWLAHLLAKTPSSEGSGEDRIMTNETAFESGWKAWYKDESLEHVLVNGWENGWIVPEGSDVSKVKVIFWPQYLEWGGMILAVATLGHLGYKSRKETQAS